MNIKGFAVVGFEGDEGYITYCGGETLFGGFGLWGAKTSVTKQYTNLPPHESISLSFNFFKIDSWDNHYFLVYVNGVLVYNRQFGYEGK